MEISTIQVVIAIIAIVAVYLGVRGVNKTPKKIVAPKATKPRRGRPKGSKNKTAKVIVTKPKRGRGRPKGSKNKPKNVKAN